MDAPVGGGILCAVRRSIPCSIVDLAVADDLELLAVALRFPQRNVFVVTAYIPPGSSSFIYESAAAAVDRLAESMLPSDELVLLGDFNMPAVTWDFSDNDDCLLPSLSSAPQYVSTFLDSIASSGLVQSNSISNEAGRFLDLVFSSDFNCTLVKRCLSPLVPATSHHPALHVILCFDSVSPNLFHLEHYSFDFKKADFSIMNVWLDNFDWSAVLGERDVEKAVSLFYESLFACFSHCVPVSRSKHSSSYQPWFNDSLKHLKNLKNKAWRRFCSSRCDSDYLLFSYYRSRFLYASEVAYMDYISRMKLTLKNEPKRFWRLINAKRKSDGFPTSLTFNNVESSDPLTIANLFADFFSSSFIDTNCDISFNDFSHLTKLPPTSLTSKDLSFDDASVSKHISNLADSFLAGPDGVPSCVLKRCSSSLVPVLCYLFNLSFNSGIFPKAWKLSIITPLHKKGSKRDVSSYRPIANLCGIAKIFESLVCDVLYFHCKPFMGSFQHGFTRGKSTTTNLLEFSNYCLSSIEAGGQVDCIYTDFSKAFDRINHRILIYKLTLLGFPASFVNWLYSYLSDRTQRVLFRGALSNEIYNSSGVPQGSHLGPILFIIYINDVYLSLSHCRILCYADDIKIFRAVSTVNDCVLLNSDLNTFYSWCSNNLLPLNVDKCTVVSFTRKRNPLRFDFSIDGSSLTRLDRTKDLGVIFNTCFSFENHIDSIVSKANTVLGFVRRWSRELNDPHISKLLYCTFVRPILEYASPVWAPFYAIHIDRIEAVQRRFIRFALRDLPWRDPVALPPYSDRLKLLSLDTLEYRRNVCKIVFAFDCLQGIVDSPELLCSFDVNVPSRTLRNHHFLQLRHHRTNYGAHEPITSMSRLFNRHADLIDFNLTKSQLKALLK